MPIRFHFGILPRYAALALLLGVVARAALRVTVAKFPIIQVRQQCCYSPTLRISADSRLIGRCPAIFGPVVHLQQVKSIAAQFFDAYNLEGGLLHRLRKCDVSVGERLSLRCGARIFVPQADAPPGHLSQQLIDRFLAQIKEQLIFGYFDVLALILDD